MELDLKIRRHPARHALLAYAENLVDNRAAIDRAMAAHISQCPVCSAEVKAIQASLSFAVSAPELEPGSDLTAQILLAGRQARSEMKQTATPLRVAWKVVKGGACAAAMIMVAGLAFTAFLEAPASTHAAAPVTDRPAPEITAVVTSPEALRKAAVDVAAEGQALSAAIQSKHGESLDAEDLEQLRMVRSRGGDLAVAVSALERNPHNVRATHVVNANLKSLRSMYVEGGGSL